MKFLSTRKSAGVAAVAVLGLLASACEVETAATQLNVVQDSESSFFENGDEPYVGIVQWRVTPGVPGSTQVSLLTELDDDLGSGLDAGDSVAIPAANGVVTFDNVTPVAFQQLLTGTLPELMGTVVIAMESDFTPWSYINDIFHAVEDALEVELAAQIEPLTFADLTDQAAVSAALTTASANVQAAVEPSFFEAVELFFVSLFNPDDVIGIGFTVYVASAGPLSNVVNASLLSGLPSGAIGGAWSNNLDPIPGTLTFSDGDAIYEVEVVANASP